MVNGISEPWIFSAIKRVFENDEHAPLRSPKMASFKAFFLHAESSGKWAGRFLFANCDEAQMRFV